MKKVSVSVYFLLLIVLTGINLVLRYFALPNYFFILGFRFYGIILPIGIFLYFYLKWEPFKQSLYFFSFKKFYRYIFFILIPPVIIIGGLFLLNKIELGDPDFFYELGLSSLVDFPIYFIWNLPQFFILYTLLQTVESSFRLKILPNFILLFFFFLPEFPSVPKITVDVFSAISFSLFLFAVSLLINKKKNSLTFSFYIFTTLWMVLLLFGSTSELLLQTFLAKTYTVWDGFFEINKKFSSYIVPIYFTLTLTPIIFLKKER